MMYDDVCYIHMYVHRKLPLTASGGAHPNHLPSVVVIAILYV